MSLNYTFINYLFQVLTYLINTENPVNLQNPDNIYNDLNHADLVEWKIIEAYGGYFLLGFG